MKLTEFENQCAVGTIVVNPETDEKGVVRKISKSGYSVLVEFGNEKGCYAYYEIEIA